MSQMPSSIIIYTRPGSHGHYCDAHGAFGGGYTGARAGETPEEAALFALREEARYINHNPLGGTISAPADVRAAMVAARVHA